MEIYRDQNSREFCSPTCALHFLLPFTQHLPQRRKLDVKLNIHRLDLSGPTSDQCFYQSWANVRCQRWADDILLIGALLGHPVGPTLTQSIGPTSDQCFYQSWANVRCQRWAEDILLIGPCWPTGWCDVEPIYWLNIRLTFLLKLGQRQMPRLGQFTGPTSD